MDSSSFINLSIPTPSSESNNSVEDHRNAGKLVSFRRKFIFTPLQIFQIPEAQPDIVSIEDVHEIEYQVTADVQADDMSLNVDISGNTNETYSAKEEEGTEKIIQQSDYCGKNHNFFYENRRFHRIKCQPKFDQPQI